MTQQEASVLQTANRGLPQGWEAVYIEESGQKVMRYLNGSLLRQERPARDAEILQGLERRLADG